MANAHDDKDKDAKEAQEREGKARAERAEEKRDELLAARGGGKHLSDRERHALRAQTRAENPPPEIRFVSPFDDPEGLITAPLADPIANGSALVIPPAVLDESLLPEGEPPVGPIGDPLPDLQSLTGKQQELVEIQTGKRLQRPEGSIRRDENLLPGRRPVGPDQELPPPRPSRPVINPRPGTPSHQPA